ncbi:MAG: hypothetical protein H7195_02580 [Chryseobacterium sp.]|nr:hypothetical protein [Chryseobacterium sp.]
MNKIKKFYLLTLFVGVIFLTTYFLQDFLYRKMWIFTLIPLYLFGIIFLILFIISIIKKNKIILLMGIMIIMIISITELFTSELFKGKKILEATLKDDLSSMHLILRDNNKFELMSSDIFTQEVYKGKYELLKNKIIFEDKPYINSFIPDTLTIINNEIIIRFDKNETSNRLRNLF